MSGQTNITRESILNQATDSIRAKGGLTTTLRTLCTAAKTGDAPGGEAINVSILAPLADALTVANPDQLKVIRATFGAVSLEVFGQRWGFKGGSLAPTTGAGGRPAKTTEDKVRALIASDGWKAVLSAVYTVAQQDAEAARELLAVVEVLSPGSK